MNTAFLISLVSGTLNLGTALLLAAISRSPAWRAARAYFLIALSAGLYSLINLTFCTDGLPLSTYLIAGRLEYLVGTFHCVCWLLPAFGGASASFRGMPKFIRRVAAGTLGMGTLLTLTGIHLLPSVDPLEVPWARARYHYPETNLAGDIYGLFVLLVLALSFFQFLRRFRGGERSLRLQTIGFCLYYLCIIVEVLVANRMIQFISLGDVGFLLLVSPITIQVVRRILTDSERLLQLTTRLEEEIRRRTEERDRTQLALVEAERLAAIGRLAAGVGHEINNPLTYLQLALTELELFHRAGKVPPTISDALAKAQEGSRRIKKVVEDLRTHSRRQEDRGPLDLAQLIQAAAKLASPQMHSVPRFIFEPDPGLRVFGNRSYLIQAITNLLINAAQAASQSNDQGCIKVRTSRGTGGKAILAVEDNGPGIPAENLPRLGTPYFTTRASSGSLGLGLFVAQGIVASHNGRLEFETQPGKGTQVRMTLPLLVDNPPADRCSAEPSTTEPIPSPSGVERPTTLPMAESDFREKPETPRPEPTKTPRDGKLESAPRRDGDIPQLLLVDDEIHLGQMLARALRQDFKVTLARSAGEALQLLETERYDAALCDLMMPGMSGIELADVLGAQFPQLRRRTLFLTGGAITSEAEAFLKRPDVRHLEKPVQLSDLKTRLQELIKA